MDSDAKYLKRKVKAGRLDVHPTEKALVVNYELEATILGELGDPMLGDRKECQKIIRLKSLNSQTDITALAKEIINKCKLIHPSKVPEVEQLLYYLKNRKEKAEPSSDPLSDDQATSNSSDSQLRIQSASLHRYSPVEDLRKDDDEIANINYLEDYIELLYEEVSSKVRGSGLILQLARNPDNLEELAQNETLLGALSRVLREEWRISIDLSTNIIYVFFCFSTFSQFHPIIARYKVGSLVMDIVEYEIHRYKQFLEEAKKKNESEEAAKSERRFNVFVSKQDQALRVSIYLLLNLAEKIDVEEKMKRKGIVKMLVGLLDRRNVELSILVVSFLKKLSCYSTNKDEMKVSNIITHLVPILTHYNNDSSTGAADLTNATVRLLLNLSFDSELRNQMVKVGMLPKLVQLMADARHQNPVCCVLYHLSIDDKVKSMFTYTDCIPIIMRMILESKEEQVDLEVMSLGINLAANKRNAQLICEGHGLRMLMQRAFHYQDALVMKMIRNISQHDGITKNLFIEFIGDIADAVQRADSEEFIVECVGILGNLTITDLDFERLLKEYDLLPWMKQKLVPGNHKHGEDDLVLEVVVFIGTCATDSYAAQYMCKSNTLECLIDLLKAKQEDDEIVLQVVYVFHQLCVHEETRKFIIQDTDAVAYIIDLMHDKNPEVQRVCDRTLDIISQYDDSWSERVQREKFKFHNAQWLEIVQKSTDHLSPGVYGSLLGPGEIEDQLSSEDPLCYADVDEEFEALIRQSEGFANNQDQQEMLR